MCCVQTPEGLLQKQRSVNLLVISLHTKKNLLVFFKLCVGQKKKEIHSRTATGRQKVTVLFVEEFIPTSLESTN